MHARRGLRTGLIWLRPSGLEMTDQRWTVGYVRCIGMLLNGHAREWADDGSLIYDDPLLVLFNAHHEGIPFKLPPCGETAEVVTPSGYCNRSLRESLAVVCPG